MKGRADCRLILSLHCLLLSALLAVPLRVPAAAPDGPIAAHSAEVDGLKLHYLKAGHAAPLVLLHGYTQSWRMWKPIIPRLAEKFTVIAPDRPGMGDSEIPEDGMDLATAARRLHALARSLGSEQARVVGHHSGLM